MSECPDIGSCDCEVEVVAYNGLKGIGHPENLGWMYWPLCANTKTVQDVKLQFDIEAGRNYKGARR